MGPAIIEVALNGTTNKECNPHVPRSPAEPWRPILERHPDVQLYATQASGGPGVAIETRWAHHAALARAGVLRVGLIDPGSVNLGDRVYVNTAPDARYAADRCAELGLTASVSISDPSFLRAALALPLPPATMIKLYFGASRSSAATSSGAVPARSRWSAAATSASASRTTRARAPQPMSGWSRRPPKRSPRPAVASPPPLRRARSSADRSVISYVKEFRYGLMASTDTLVTP